MTDIRLAIVGGAITERTPAEAIDACPWAQPVAIVNPSDSGKPLAAKQGCADPETPEALIDLRPEGVIIAAPDALHVPQAMQLICLPVAQGQTVPLPPQPVKLSAEPHAMME